MKKNLTSTSFWENHRLIAIDECVMENTNIKSLMIGESYVPIRTYDDEFVIIDDNGHNHYFEWSDYEKYFKIEPEEYSIGIEFANWLSKNEWCADEVIVNDKIVLGFSKISFKKEIWKFKDFKSTNELYQQFLKEIKNIS